MHRNAAGAGISFDALVGIHLVHRWFALLAVLAAGVLAWRLRRLLPRSAAWLAGLLVLQFATGLSNVVLGWPLLAALLHTGGAAALVLVLTWVWASAASPAEFAAAAPVHLAKSGRLV